MDSVEDDDASTLLQAHIRDNGVLTARLKPLTASVCVETWHNVRFTLNDDVTVCSSLSEIRRHIASVHGLPNSCSDMITLTLLNYDSPTNPSDIDCLAAILSPSAVNSDIVLKAVCLHPFLCFLVLISQCLH